MLVRHWLEALRVSWLHSSGGAVAGAATDQGAAASSDGAPSNGTQAPAPRAHGQIRSLRVQPPHHKVRVEATDALANENGDPGAFTIHRNHNDGNVTVVYQVSGTAEAGKDYQGLSGSVTLSPGQDSRTIRVDPIDDLIPDSGETVVLTLSSVSDDRYVIDAESQSDAVTIHNTESGGAVWIEAIDAAADENGDPGEFMVHRDGSTGSLTVDYSISGAATEGDDYQSLSGSVTIDGASGGTISINPIDDIVQSEGDEDVVLTLTGVSDPSYTIDALNDTDTVWIADNDSSGGSGGGSDPGGIIVESDGSTAVHEAGATSDTYTIRLASQPTDNVVVDIVKYSGDISHENVTISPDTLTFTPGNWSTPQTVTVTAIDDDFAEECGVSGGGLAELEHLASSLDLAYDGLDLGTVYASVVDDDTAGVTVTPLAVSAAEGGASATYSVVLDTPPYYSGSFEAGYEYWVQVDLWPDSQVDVAPASLIFNSSNWSTPQTVTVTAEDDTVDENDLHLGIISHEATTPDGLSDDESDPYEGIRIDDVVVKITDNDTAAPLNEAPIAGDDAYSLASGSISGDVLANDFDPNTGDTLTPTKLSDPLYGTLTFNSDGTFTYTAGANYTGSDSFEYQVSDGNETATATVRIRNTPAASDDFYTIGHNLVLEVGGSGAIGNDSDAEDDPLTAYLVTEPTNGAVTFQAGDDSFGPDGTFHYVPLANFVGVDSFTYVVNDGTSDSNTATVRIRVTNTAPVAVSDLDYTVPEDGTLTVDATAGLVGNDRDPDSQDDDGADDLYVKLISGPASGTLLFNEDGSFNSPQGVFTYTPYPNFVGRDSFTYVISDGMADSQEATVLITVQPGSIADLDGADIADSASSAFWLSETDETDLGMVVDDGSGLFPAQILAHRTGRSGYTRVITWDPMQLNVFEGVPISSGSITLEECEGDVTFPVTATANFPLEGSQNITLSVYDASGILVAANNVRAVRAKAQIDSIEFTSDHNVLHKNGAGLLTAGGAYNRTAEVDYDLKTGKIKSYAQITHTAGDTQKLKLTLNLRVTGIPNGTPFQITGTGSTQPGGGGNPIPEFNFSKTGTLTVNGGQATVDLTATNPLGSALREIEGWIEWNLQFDLDGDGAFASFGTQHQPVALGTTYGTPQVNATPTPQQRRFDPLVATPKRILRAMEQVNAAISDLQMAGKVPTPVRIVWELMKNQTFNLSASKAAETSTMAWRVPDALKDYDRPPDGILDPGGDCISIATFVSYVGQMMGIPGSYQPSTYIAKVDPVPTARRSHLQVVDIFKVALLS